MTGEEKELMHRVEELSSRSLDRGVYTQTRFLTEGEIAFISSLKLPLAPCFEGGFSEAERCVAVFGSEEDLYYSWDNTIVLLQICQPDPKFAKKLTHRDFLGAILNLGIERDLIGDILVHENTGYVFCLRQIAPYLTENLKRVGSSTVSLQILNTLPEDVSVQTVAEEVVSASPRLDAVVSAVFHISRSEGKNLVEREKVSVKGRLVSDPGRALIPGERVSVRGYGRFYFDGETGETRSGRSRIAVRRFI